MSRMLSRLLHPRSVAVVGGGAWCANVVEQCRKMGFTGEIWPVHPRKTEIAGTPAFREVDDLPGPPDAVFIGVNRHTTVDIVSRLRARGAGGAVCFASGFRETDAETSDGAALQAALVDAAGDMPILGPNCYGLINYLDGALLWPDQHGGRRVASGVAVLTQSSNIALNVTMQARGLPLAYVATAGNQAQTGLADIGDALLADERVTALGLHIEGIGDLRAFERLAATARRLGKPVVALKAGRSAQARAAAVSHTASMTGSDAGARALLRRLGIAQVHGLTGFLETLKLLHFAGPLPSDRIASMSCSGGEASLVADLAVDRGIRFPALSEAQVTGLRAALGPMVALANPLDYHTFIWQDAEKMGGVFCAMLDGDADLGCLIVDFPRADRCDPAAWDCVMEAGAHVVAARSEPFVLLSTLPEALSEEVAARAIEAGLIPLHGLEDALTAIEAAAFVGMSRKDPAPILAAGAPRDVRTLFESDAKAALAAHGLAVPRAERVADRTSLDRVLKSTALPFVVKTDGLAHKTEAGGVKIFRTKPGDVSTVDFSTTGTGWLVEELVEGGVAELLIGVLRDPAHGFVLTLGAGGTRTELWDDTVSCLLPADADDIRDMLARLRIAPLLHGYRGAAPARIETIVSAVLAVQDYVVAHRETLEEVEINPLIVTPDRAVAVDALIRKGDD